MCHAIWWPVERAEWNGNTASLHMLYHSSDVNFNVQLSEILGDHNTTAKYEK